MSKEMKTLLLVADDAAMSLGQTRKLRVLGFEVITVFSSEAALERLQGGLPIDLILIDLSCEAGGVRVAESILRDHDLPILFLCDPQASAAVAGTETLSFYGYVVKGSADAILVASFKKAFHLYDTHLELKRREQTLQLAQKEHQRAEEELHRMYDLLGRRDQDLRSSEEKFFKAFHLTPLSMVLSTLPEGRYIEVNQAFLELVGCTRDEVIGHTSLELGLWVDPALRARLRADLAREGGLRDAPFQLRTRSGEVREALYSAERIPLGGQPHLIAQAVDITEQKKAGMALRQHVEGLESLARTTARMLEPLSMADLFKIAADQIHAFAKDAVVAFCEFDPQNQKIVVREIRCTPEERERLVRILGRDPEGFALDFPEEVRALMLPGKLGLVQGGLHGLAVGQPPASLVAWIEKELNIADILAMPCSAEGEILGALAVLTHERGTVLNKNLIESVVNQAALAIKRKRVEDALHQADRHKNDFLAILSHELRSPLAPIRHSLYVLERAAFGTAQAGQALAIIGRQTTHLSRMVDDLLDLTRITRGKIHLHRERLELGELVRRTAEDHRAMFLARGIALELLLGQVPVWIDGDVTRIAQIVGNLLNNAAKFTSPEGRVALILEAEESAALLQVRDNGVGIASGVLQQLFQPFMQAAQTLDRTQGGLGLGLALVKGLVELHGGSVSAASEGSGRGAEFFVRLPRCEPEQMAPRPTVAPQPKRRRIVVIEDNPDAADSLLEVLELMGHEVALASTGPAGMTLARELCPDIVLCDIGLPGMNGYEVAQAMRENPQLQSTFLIALSGYAQPEDVAKAEAAGFNLHLAKPPSLEQLEQLLAGAATHS